MCKLKRLWLCFAGYRLNYRIQKYSFNQIMVIFGGNPSLTDIITIKIYSWEFCIKLRLMYYHFLPTIILHTIFCTRYFCLRSPICYLFYRPQFTVSEIKHLLKIFCVLFFQIVKTGFGNVKYSSVFLRNVKCSFFKLMFLIE